MLILITIWLSINLPMYGQIESDMVRTSEGQLEMYFIGHGTLMLLHNGLVIHKDPTVMYGNYDNAPKADLILVTHEHGDSFDMRAIRKITKENTRIVATRRCEEGLEGYDPVIMENGDTTRLHGVDVVALPAYNIKHKQFNWKPYHEEGIGNSYLITLGDKRILIGGDTENVPELKALSDIDIAFLPMDMPFTMSPSMVADLARHIRPRILYPYHYGRTDPTELLELLREERDIDVRIRDL